MNKSRTVYLAELHCKERMLRLELLKARRRVRTPEEEKDFVGFARSVLSGGSIHRLEEAGVSPSDLREAEARNQRLRSALQDVQAGKRPSTAVRSEFTKGLVVV